MLNTLTKPRFQKFVKIFQGPTDRPTDMTTPRSSDPELKKGDQNVRSLEQI